MAFDSDLLTGEQFGSSNNGCWSSTVTSERHCRESWEMVKNKNVVISATSIGSDVDLDD